MEEKRAKTKSVAQKWAKEECEAFRLLTKIWFVTEILPIIYAESRLSSSKRLQKSELERSLKNL